MQIIKSLGDGIGTAAGVAWPIFGIIFGTLALSIGASTTAIILSSISIGLFCLIAVPITCWSYMHAQKDKLELQNTIRKQEDKLYELTLDCVFSILRECLFKNKKYINYSDKTLLIERIKKSISNIIEQNKPSSQITKILDSLLDDEKSNYFLSNLIAVLNINKTNITNDFKLVEKFNLSENQMIHGSIKTLCKNNYNFVSSNPPLFAQIKIGIIGFFSSFGSIAGCASGVLGLLASIGVFAGLATVPVVGWAILGLSIVFGLVVAGVCVYSLYDRYNKNQMIIYNENINRELENIVILNNIKIDARIEAHKKYQNHTSKNIINNTAMKRSRSADFSYINSIHHMWDNSSSDQSQHTSHNHKDKKLPVNRMK